MIIAASTGVPPHCQASDGTRQQTIHCAKGQLLLDQLAHGIAIQVPKRDSAKRDRQRLASRVAALARKDRQESRQRHDLRDGALEKAYHEARCESSQQVHLQPGMTHLESRPDPRVNTLLLVHTDHLTRLRADLDRLTLEQAPAAYHADHMSVGIH